MGVGELAEGGVMDQAGPAVNRPAAPWQHELPDRLGCCRRGIDDAAGDDVGAVREVAVEHEPLADQILAPGADGGFDGVRPTLATVDLEGDPVRPLGHVEQHGGIVDRLEDVRLPPRRWLDGTHVERVLRRRDYPILLAVWHVPPAYHGDRHRPLPRRTSVPQRTATRRPPRRLDD